MTKYIFKLIYNRNSDSLSVLWRWCIEVELLLTRSLILYRIIWAIAFTGSENADLLQLFPNNKKFENCTIS